MEDKNIIAKSADGSGLLPMKQSKELEVKKSTKQIAEETCNFIKNAFCVDGTVYLTKDLAGFKIGNKVIPAPVFMVEDKTRGRFFVSYTM